MNNPVLTLTFLFLFLVFPALAFSQTEVAVTGANGATAFTFQMNTADPGMKKVPSTVLSQRQMNPAEFVRLLAEYIAEKSTNDFNKVKKTHDWVALNIKYDTQSYFGERNYPPQNFTAVNGRKIVYTITALNSDLW